MKNLVLFSAVSLALCGAFSSAGCSSSSTTPGTGGGTTTTTTHTTTTSSSTSTTSTSTTSTSTTSTTTTAANPAPPALGMQIDRFGRPAINTALNHAFDANTTTAGAAKDTYNQSADPTTWVAANTPEFAKNLAILDALDTVCGNQPPGYTATTVTATSYNTLAGVLAGDVVWLNTAGTACTTYLGVELNALGLKANTDCGGRALAYDVIDVSYSSLSGTAGVGDGVPANDSAFTATFPYLAVAH